MPDYTKPLLFVPIIRFVFWLSLIVSVSDILFMPQLTIACLLILSLPHDLDLFTSVLWINILFFFFFLYLFVACIPDAS